MWISLGVAFSGLMMTHGWLKAWLGPGFNLYVLGAIAGIIAAGVMASLIANRRRPAAVP